MATPTTKEEFAHYCLRKLGAPVLNINVSDDQIDDRISEALNKFHQFHYDGSEKIYMKHKITQTDKNNGYIETSDLVISVVEIFDLTSFSSSSSLFNVNYQFALNDLFNIQSTGIVPYYIAMQHMSTLNFFFSTKPSIRFNEHTNKLYIDDWSNINVDNYLVISCFRILDPNDYSKIWSNLWLQKYTTALIKKQWGENISKFDLVLPSGVKFNGNDIINRASDEIKTLEEELVDMWSIPSTMMIG